MNRFTKIILKISSYIIVAVILIFAILTIGIKSLGFQLFAVLSGSMEPELKVGSVIYVKETNIKDLKVGDVITYRISENTFSTHRITEIIINEENPEIRTFKTKGDANEDEDALLVQPTDIKGKVTLDIPYLGYITNYIQNPPGRYIAFIIGGTLVIYVFIIDALTSEKKKNNLNAKEKKV